MWKLSARLHRKEVFVLWLCRVIRVSMKDIWDFNGHGEKVHCMRIEAGDHWIDKDMTAWGRFGGMSFEWA